MRAILGISGTVLAVAIAAVAVGSWRWRRDTDRWVARLGHPGRSETGSRFSAAAVADLPAPVARYFRTVLREGQPLVRRVRLEQEGEFLVRPKDGGWGRFTATQHAVAGPAGFVWDARISMAPGVTAQVRDAFADGLGSMRASVFGVFTVVATEGTPDIATGSLMRYLAEAVWFPTALLPTEGVEWTAVDSTTARAALAVGGTRVELDFHFGPDGLVERIYSPARMRDVAGRGVPTPWQGRFSDYQVRDGMRVPIRGEVEWLLPDGPAPYWRGTVVTFAFETDD